MKKLFFVFAALTAVVLSSCTHPAGSELMGTWNLSEYKLQFIEDITSSAQDRLQMLKDSAAATTDTAKQNMFNSQASMLEANLASMQKEQDSVMHGTSWMFGKDSVLIANEAGTKDTAKWWYVDAKKTLYRKDKMGIDSVVIKLEGDNLTLQFDSLNYMKFAKAK